MDTENMLDEPLLLHPHTVLTSVVNLYSRPIARDDQDRTIKSSLSFTLSDNWSACKLRRKSGTRTRHLNKGFAGALHPRVLNVLGSRPVLHPEAFLGHLKFEKIGALEFRGSFELPTLPSFKKKLYACSYGILGKPKKAHIGNIANVKHLQIDILRAWKQITYLKTMEVGRAHRFAIKCETCHYLDYTWPRRYMECYVIWSLQLEALN